MLSSKGIRPSRRGKKYSTFCLPNAQGAAAHRLLYQTSKQVVQAYRWHQTEGVGHSIHAAAVRHLRHAVQTRQHSTRVPTVHGVCARCKGLPALAPIRGGARVLPVHKVTGDSENTEGWDGVAVGPLEGKVAAEPVSNPCCNVIHTVVIVSILWKVAIHLQNNAVQPACQQRQQISFTIVRIESRELLLSAACSARSLHSVKILPARSWLIPADIPPRLGHNRRTTSSGGWGGSGCRV